MPIVLVGTKKDLREDQEILRRLAARGLAPVTTQQGAFFSCAAPLYRRFVADAPFSFY